MTSIQRFRVEQRRHRDTFLARTPFTQEHVENLEQEQQSPVTVFRLPAETMAEIFLYTQLASYDYTKAEYKNMGWCWLTITHVCKYWRDAAIGTQALWTYINTGEHANAEQTAVYLERSAISPLIVTHNDEESHTDGKSIPSLRLALQEVHRIRELDIYIWKSNLGTPPAELEALMLSLTQISAPALEAFVLNILSEDMYDIRTLFAGCAPRLEMLALRINSPFYAAPVMQNLKILVIAPIPTSVTMQDTFSILQENPNLEELRIQLPLSYAEAPHLGGPLTLTISPIRLSYLEELTLQSVYYEQLRCFFRNVILPEIISGDIICVEYPIKHQDAEPRSIIPWIYSENSQYTILELEICYKFVTIKSDVSSATGQHDDESTSRRFITYSWEGEADVFEERVTAFECFSLVYSVMRDRVWLSLRILTVEIEGNMSYSASTSEESRYLPWIQLLEMLPNLEELTCRHVATIEIKKTIKETHYGLLKALACASKGEDGKAHVICPNLSVLRLCGMDFDSGLVHLVQSLAQRAFNYSRLSKIQLDRPYYMSRMMLRSLKESEVVGNIEVLDWNLIEEEI